jgi:hypothetical protein
MKKIALFVEGQTEQIFAAELVKHIFGRREISVEKIQFSGKMGARKITIIHTTKSKFETSYYFRIYDCHGGGEISTVKSDIIEQLESLKREGFSGIIGIRDVYPLTDIEKLKKMLNFGIPKSNIPVHIVLAIQEVESWFLAEDKHYERITPELNVGIANSICKIDIQKESTETIAHPAETLNEIYKVAGRAYRKRKIHIERTVEALDYNNLYLNVRARNKSLDELFWCLEGELE